MSLEISVSDELGVKVLKCNGSVDVTNYRQMEDAIKEFISNKQYKIIIDLKDTQRVSSVAWDLFVMYYYMCRKNAGDLKLASIGHETKTIFELLDLQTVLRTYDSVGDAMDSFRGYTGRAF